MPDGEIRDLQALIGNIHNYSYPEFFQESWENGPHNIDNFFDM